MNTRKDYWRAVRIIQNSPNDIQPWLTTAFIAFFAKDNPRFDAKRFAQAVTDFPTGDSL